MNTRTFGRGACAILLVAVGGVQADNLKKVEFTDDFPDLADCDSLATSTAAGAQNKYLPLEIYRQWTLSNASCVIEGECDELEEVVITVLDETEVIDGVATRVVEERESVNGTRREVSRNFLVECVGTEDIYYMGEGVDIYDDTGTNVVSHAGEWRAEGPNRPGILMPGGAFLLGASYYQEWAPDVALDRAQHLAMGLTFDNPADGEFLDCVLIEDTNALEDPKGKDGDDKAYCPGIGFVMDEAMELTGCIDGMGAACSQP